MLKHIDDILDDISLLLLSFIINYHFFIIRKIIITFRLLLDFLKAFILNFYIISIRISKFYILKFA